MAASVEGLEIIDCIMFFSRVKADTIKSFRDWVVNMNRLMFYKRVPYSGGYVLNLPEKAMVGQGMNFPALLRSIKEWRRANSVPIGLGFEDEVEKMVCDLYPQECSGAIDGKPRKSRLSLSAVLRGTRVLLAFKLAGSPYVSQEEAERRASICASCVWNLDYAKPCNGNCGGLKEMVSAIVGGQKTSFDDRLKACGICGCTNAAQILMPLDVLEKGVTADMKEQFAAVEKCWKKL